MSAAKQPVFRVENVTPILNGQDMQRSLHFILASSVSKAGWGNDFLRPSIKTVWACIYAGFKVIPAPSFIVYKRKIAEADKVKV